MSKRTPGLVKRPRGYWPTPREAVVPLIPFLPITATYGEPCAGDGALIRALDDLWPGGRCGLASDIEPQGPGILATDVASIGVTEVSVWITNPPRPEGGRRGDPALSIIQHLAGIAPTWALLPWDFAANAYFGGVAAMCSDIVPIGRVSWLGNGVPGKDNAAWLRFCRTNRRPPAVWARAA